jgi:hypothetical protein
MDKNSSEEVLEWQFSFKVGELWRIKGERKDIFFSL